MICRKFGRLGNQASAIGLGTWNLGDQWGKLTEKEAEAIVRGAVDSGITLIDTADSYGNPHGLSELRLGRYLQGMRDRVMLVSKIAHWGKRSGQAVPMTTADMVRMCGYACLGRLKTDHLDVLLCHDWNPEHPEIYVAGLRALRQEGAIREYGISTDSLDVLKKFCECSDGECSFVEFDYSLLNNSPEYNGMMAYCREKEITMLTRGPLSRGLLSGRYDRNTVFTDDVRSCWNRDGAQRPEYEKLMDRLDGVKEKLAAVPDMDLPTYALRYIISRPEEPFVIPGATSAAQVQGNAKAGQRLLTAEELAFAR